MRTSTGLALALGLLLPSGAAARAEAAPEGGAAVKPSKGGVFPEPTAASDEDAKRILADLKAAIEKGDKDEKKLVDAVAAMVEKKHKDFLPDLKKLLTDRRDRVAAEASLALGSQGDRTVAPLLLKVLAAKTRDKEGFLRDPETKAAAAEALGRLGDLKSEPEVLGLAKDMRGSKEVTAVYAKRVVRGCVRYFGLVKDRESVTYLIDEVDQPGPKDPNSNTNPGESYWKDRFAIWTEVRPEVTWALKEITGKEFDSGRRWENWYKDEGRKAGFK